MSGIVGLERECFLDAILESGIKRVPLKQTFTERMQYFQMTIFHIGGLKTAVSWHPSSCFILGKRTIYTKNTCGWLQDRKWVSQRLEILAVDFMENISSGQIEYTLLIIDSRKGFTVSNTPFKALVQQNPLSHQSLSFSPKYNQINGIMLYGKRHLKAQSSDLEQTRLHLKFPLMSIHSIDVCYVIIISDSK